ncbi:hypothetical protein CHLRE_17g728350v5 [Chlamydomonas reinhardtii]|uniref:FAS1 domain-containing protein n=1 Tax=Chlamydomonas reinhardtii TaxID=3055 RepID=A0A2K3CQT3_CHLRE|nr:uncharacterized protein CHLRE_17g728350v5 [Chlamydomonas reinhardtii]PNW70639.1 hypothetical protein CHLRE_17g728350v5 [Chlamydomonas reinhardtii]
MARHSLLLLGVAATAALLLLTASPFAAQGSTRRYSNPAQYICNDPDLTTLCRILRAAGPDSKAAAALQDATVSNTVFAPLDSAFSQDAKRVASKLSLGAFEKIYTSPKQADRLLQNLIIPGQAISSNGFKTGTDYKSMLGQHLYFKGAWFTKDLYVQSEEVKAKIIQVDIPAGRSVVYTTDRVPLPSAPFLGIGHH